MIMYAYYLALFLEGENRVTYRMMCQINSKNNDWSMESIDFIGKHLDSFESALPCDKTDCDFFEELATLFIGKTMWHYYDSENSFVFNAQFHIFHAKTGTLIKSIPSEFDEEKRQLYFLSDVNNLGDLVNVGIIANIATFFSVYKYWCFYCRKTLSSKGCQHMCKRNFRECCFNCRRPFLRTNTYVTDITRKFFCDANLTSATIQDPCSQCSMKIKTKHCLKNHVSRVCKRGFFCNGCNIYSYTTAQYSSTEALKKAHVHGVRPCKFCGGQIKDSKHQCQISIPSFPKEFPNLCFLQFVLTGYNMAQCDDCYTKLSQCEFCNDQESNVRPNLAGLLVESSEREYFDTIVFSDDEILIEKPTERNFHYSYLPQHSKKISLAPKGRKTYFNQRKRTCVDKNLFESDKSVVAKVLNYFLTNGLSNFTVVVHNEERELHYIKETLYKHGIFPKSIQHQQKLYILDVEQLGLYFVDATNYVDGSLQLLSKKHNLMPLYFPLKLNKKSFYSYCGEPPSFDNYFHFEDSCEQKEEKKSYVQNLEYPWNFVSNITEYCVAKVTVCATALLSFIRHAFDCQDALAKEFHPKINADQLPYIHPLQDNIFTKSTYAYKVYLAFVADAKCIQTVNPPIDMTSSRGELAYAGYLQWCNPNIEYNHGWSSYGQTKDFLPLAIPDAYGAGEFHYYNGCMIHGDWTTTCKYMQKRDVNAFNVPKETARKKFEIKIDKLKKTFPNKISSIHVMWQCNWEKMLKEDQNLKYFMEHVYRFPPLYRLNPRCAGNTLIPSYLHCPIHLAIFFSSKRRIQ